jgi:hypothetical protein
MTSTEWPWELYWDKPQEPWPRTQDGQLAMVTRSFDLDSLLQEPACTNPARDSEPSDDLPKDAHPEDEPMADPTPDLFLDAVLGFQKTAALKAALALDLFHDRGPGER